MIRTPIALQRPVAQSQCGDSTRSRDVCDNETGPHRSPQAPRLACKIPPICLIPCRAERSKYGPSALAGNVLKSRFKEEIRALTGAVFRTVELPKTFEDELDDVTLSGVSFQAAAQDIFSRVLDVGRHGVLIDWSDTNARPYWTRYDAPSITNWMTQRIGWKQVLTQVILHEIATTPSDDPFRPSQTEQYWQLLLQVQVLTEEGVGAARQRAVRVPQHRLAAEGDEGRKRARTRRVGEVSDTVPMRRGEAIPFIPFTFSGPGGIDPMPMRPPLIDLVEVNLAHYRVSADHKHALFLTAQPTPLVTGAKVGMLEFTGSGVEAMRLDLRDMQQQMSVLGARLLEQTRASLAEQANRALARAGRPEQIHAGSLAQQLTEVAQRGDAREVARLAHREPGMHLGPHNLARVERGESLERVAEVGSVDDRNQALAAERTDVSRLEQALQHVRDEIAKAVKARRRPPSYRT